MPVKIAIAQIQLDQGQRVTLEDINWQEFEDILEDLGEHRHSLLITKEYWKFGCHYQSMNALRF